MAQQAPLAVGRPGRWRVDVHSPAKGTFAKPFFAFATIAGEQHDLAGDPAMQPILRRMRAELARLTGGPLTPDRFNP